jgi:hypothetical protein
MITLKKYNSTLKEEWNTLLAQSKNGTFLLNRDYMDYHSDRFIDDSLMIYRKEKPIALFPANIQEAVVYSHQGLTYGGLIYINQLSATDVLEIFNMILRYYSENNITKIIYKPIPYIYSTYPAQEDLYALFRNNATVIGSNISSTILLGNKLKFIESRKSGIRKAKNNELIYLDSVDFDAFWDILNSNLGTKHGVTPVHSLSEIKYLHDLFPENIKLYLVKKQDTVVAGTVLYLNKNVVHVQYISANPEGKELGALDLVFDSLINDLYKDYTYFDFGQSTEQMGNYLNENLLFQKEGFGGRGVVYNIYEIDLMKNQ